MRPLALWQGFMDPFVAFHHTIFAQNAFLKENFKVTKDKEENDGGKS